MPNAANLVQGSNDNKIFPSAVLNPQISLILMHPDSTRCHPKIERVFVNINKPLSVYYYLTDLSDKLLLLLLNSVDLSELCRILQLRFQIPNLVPFIQIEQGGL